MNSSILIFDMKIWNYIRTLEFKSFPYIVIGVLFLLHALAYVMYASHIPFTINDHLFNIQMHKIESAEEPVETIIVGDSSAGNAIDATLFSGLSGGQTLNLALSRLHGFEGSLNMAKQARKLHPEIKNVVFVQSLDMWALTFSREGFFKTEKGINTDEIDSRFLATYKWLDRFAFENDYVRNPGEVKTFRNGDYVIEDKKLITEPLGQNQIDMYARIDLYCKKEKINCIFIGGPLHEGVVHNMEPSYFSQIFDFTDTATSIHSVHTVFAIPNEYMGDASNHVDITYKPTMTKRYYEEMKESLVHSE